MPLTILTDDDVRNLLLQLTKQDIQDLQQSLADALHYYSTSTDEDSNGCCSSYQPLRTSLKRNDGQTTLLMPASSNDGIGVKIVTLASPDKKTPSDTASVTSSIDTLSLSQQSTRSAASSTTAQDPPKSLASSQTTTPKGSITLFDKSGDPRALINAEEITAFRTALASTMLFKKRENVHDVVVFGAGKQAYWHIRLALMLRGPDIHHLNIINRDFERVHHLLQKLYNPHEQPMQWSPSGVPQYREKSDSGLHRPKIQILTPSHGEYERLLKSTIRASSVIFFTTPSLTPLFPAPYLTNPEGRKKGRYLAAIGSYKPHMVEIHPDILRQNVAPEHGHRHFHKHAQQAGAVVVDSVEACLKEAGEIIQAGLGPNEVVEIGEIVMLKRDAERRRLECQASKSAEGLDEGGVELGECEKAKKKRRGNKEKDHEVEDKAHKSLMDWLQKGNVIYKSVGLGLMDVVVGSDLVRLADERGIGTRVDNF
ncbi:Nn.00g047460.m01.CDS01 [Neocucurbitaria sp. VM-36]